MSGVRILIAAAIVAAALPASAQDRDRDGLDDAIEQRLIEKFVPSFLLSADECDGVPASFTGGSIVTGRGPSRFSAWT